jgi:PAS domain S-box-containing protein
VFINPAVTRATGKPATEYVGRTTEELGHPPELCALWSATFRDIFQTGQPREIEFPFTAPAGKPMHFSMRAVPEFATDGTVDSVLFMLVDLTARKRSEDHLQRSLQHKEVLLREAQHRVKNDLQIIFSVMNLQEEASHSPAVRAHFQEVRERLRSMILLHEQLRHSNTVGSVDFASYARSLLKSIWDSRGNLATGIGLELNLQPVTLSTDTALPCGLILNELATNALKHAFPGRSVGGRVEVVLRQNPNGIVVLEFRDNGVGLPCGLDWQQSRTLGLRLVRLLAAQMKAIVTTSADCGTRFEISFEDR